MNIPVLSCLLSLESKLPPGSMYSAMLLQAVNFTKDCPHSGGIQWSSNVGD